VVLTALIIALDAAVVAPVFERSYAMFRSLVGTLAAVCSNLSGKLGGRNSDHGVKVLNTNRGCSARATR
jgi:hypothetical protein